MASKIKWKAKVRRTIEEEYEVSFVMTPKELCPLLEPVLDNDVSIPEKITQEWMEQNVSSWRLLDVSEIYSGYDPASLLEELEPVKRYCADVFIATCEYPKDED